MNGVLYMYVSMGTCMHIYRHTHVQSACVCMDKWFNLSVNIMSYYRIATIAMLFGTGELILAIAMNGSAQIGMFIMAGLSYFVAGSCYAMHKKDQYNYIPNAERYV